MHIDVSICNFHVSQIPRQYLEWKKIEIDLYIEMIPFVITLVLKS